MVLLESARCVRDKRMRKNDSNKNEFKRCTMKCAFIYKNLLVKYKSIYGTHTPTHPHKHKNGFTC